MPGPPPDPNAQRRDRDEGEWRVLPADGREGDPPEFPLPRPTKRELELWAKLWAKPQAIMWEKLDQVDQVALYVRRFREVEKPGATATMANLLHRLGESLGLTTAGLHRNRWVIDHRKGVHVPTMAEVDEEPRQGAAVKAGSSARDRFTVVDGVAG